MMSSRSRTRLGLEGCTRAARSALAVLACLVPAACGTADVSTAPSAVGSGVSAAGTAAATAAELPGQLTFSSTLPAADGQHAAYYFPPHEQICAWLQPGADPEAVTESGDLVLLAYDAQTGIALYGSFSGQSSITHPLVQASQLNEVTELSGPVDITMGFHEGDWDDGTVVEQDALAPLNLPRAWVSRLGRGVRVAVLDTGVDANHPMLAGHVVPLDAGAPLIGEDQANGIDDDGDGETDEAYGHGTHVAGTILTVAPEATILSLRVLNEEGWGYIADVATGLLLAREMDAGIVNLSLVFNVHSPLIAELLRELAEGGIVVVAAAGNQTPAVAYPASDPHAVSVTATDASDVAAWFAIAPGAALAAPGVEVISAFPGGGLAIASGTSMACAVASGCMALVADSNTGLSVAAARDRLFSTALDVAPSLDLVYGRVSPALRFPLLIPRNGAMAY